MKQIVAGIVAHVDAGKTTLSEALLYRTGEIRKLGRVSSTAMRFWTPIPWRRREASRFSRTRHWWNTATCA